MIPVTPQPEPADFDKKVRKPGLKWIAKSGLDPSKPVPSGTEIPSHWTRKLPQLFALHEGICAYIGMYIEGLMGSPSVDHFVPKSRALNLAYEWSNYRLACSKINSIKNNFMDVLDPFTLESGWFHLDLSDCSIFANPALTVEQRNKVQATIDRLKLDDPESREWRRSYLNAFKSGDVPSEYFKKRSPFVWLEAQRQGYL